MKEADYFLAATEVIPVLFILLALEMRYFTNWGGRQSRRTLNTKRGTLILVGVGEAAAFHSLHARHASVVEEAAVALALLWLGYAVLALAWVGRLETLRERDRLELQEAFLDVISGILRALPDKNQSDTTPDE